MINSSIFVLGFGTSISKMQTEKTKNRGNLVNLSLFHYYTTGLVSEHSTASENALKEKGLISEGLIPRSSASSYTLLYERE